MNKTEHFGNELSRASMMSAVYGFGSILILLVSQTLTLRDPFVVYAIQPVIFIPIGFLLAGGLIDVLNVRNSISQTTAMSSIKFLSEIVSLYEFWVQVLFTVVVGLVVFMPILNQTIGPFLRIYWNSQFNN
jgi:hypothetical protein